MDPSIPPEQETYYGGGESKSFFEKIGGYAVEFIETIVIFGAIFAALYLFVAQFHKVSGNSMVPTYQNGDYLITEKVNYRFREPRHGEVVVVKNPRDESQDFIKRIIAVPGDTLQISGGFVYLNGKRLEEGYLPQGRKTPAGAFTREGDILKAGSNQYFVLGDNREHSSDSREWGPVTKEEIVGRAFFRYFPVQSIGLLTNK